MWALARPISASPWTEAETVRQAQFVSAFGAQLVASWPLLTALGVPVVLTSLTVLQFLGNLVLEDKILSWLNV